MSDDQAREMRPETTSEHIARDMREGRFPEQSERQMVPVLASLPHEIQVWRSMDALDHTGTWSTTRYPAEAVTYVSKADAQAAVALMVAQAATQADPWDGPVTKNKIVDAQAIAAQQIKARIRALAPADGLAAVEALRVEARENAMQALASMGQAQEAYEAQLEAEAELARVKADAAAAQALMVERAAEAVKSLCDNDEWNLALHEALSAIRALAPIDGLALVRELREEIASSNKLLTDEARASLDRLERAETAEAERDRLAAANVALEAKVAGLREAVDEQTKARAQHWLRRTMTAPEDAEVEALCERCGYGAVMDAASRLWARKPHGSGAFYIGGCIGFKSDEEARAALATQEAGTC